MDLQHSSYLHFAQSPKSQSLAAPIFEDIHKMILQKNFPCVAAVQSVARKDYIVGIYQNFGSAQFWSDIRQDLRYFIQEQKKTNSNYLTYWAVFAGEIKFSEEQFEAHLWNELSHLSSEEEKEQDWGTNTLNPEDPDFCLSIDGHGFFVVGLHPNSSRKGRQFSSPALVFNTLEQFENLAAAGEYVPMQQTNRRRDEKFQGSVNPMVAKYGDQWESIQFSGKENSSDWKCPFHFLAKKDKSQTLEHL